MRVTYSLQIIRFYLITLVIFSEQIKYGFLYYVIFFVFLLSRSKYSLQMHNFEQIRIIRRNCARNVTVSRLYFTIITNNININCCLEAVL